MAVFLNHMGLPFPEPTLVITSPSVHCPPTKGPSTPSLTPHRPLRNTRALSALYLPSCLQPLFRTDSFPVRAVLSLLWALVKFKSWVMTVGQSFPPSGLLCPHLSSRGVGVWARMVSKASTGQRSPSPRSLCLGLVTVKVLLFLFWLAGLNPGPWQGKHRVLTTGLPRSS